jgi:hypothetical protein
MKTNQQLTTEKNLIGHFKLHNEEHNIEVTITHQRVKLNYNGAIEEFANSAHWMGENHLYFWGPYFVRFADENRLVFGKNTSGIVGVDNDWQETLERIK